MFLGISMMCFAASYSVALALELSRFLFRSGIRGAVMLGFAGAGLVAQTLYLAGRAMDAPSAPLASAHDWYLVAAWVLVVLYLALTYHFPRAAVGIFVLPLVLLLIGAAQLAPQEQMLLDRSHTERLWAMVHGVGLLAGTVAVMIGFVAGLMYLLQSRRLKSKRPLATERFRFPSLERLERINSSAILLSVLLLGVGFLSGTLLNVVSRHLPWSDPVVWTTTLMFAWQLAAALFNKFYPPARGGRKVAYLTIASFLFLTLSLGAYLIGHGTDPSFASAAVRPAHCLAVAIRATGRPA